MSREIFDILLSEWQSVDELENVQAEIGDVKMLPVESSNLAAVGYNADSYELTIAFLDGSIYRYYNVPIEEYTGLMNATGSHGEFFYDNIRLVYPFERVAG